ncbi:MAG: FG-GAP repeat protein, partial [Planctomycetota bacterium]
MHTLSPPDGEAGANFGIWSAISGDGSTLAIGQLYHGHDGIPYTGGVYVFQREGSAWEYMSELLPSDSVEGQNFGQAVGLSHDGMTLLAGAAGDSDNGVWAGAAYVFVRDGNRWVEQGKLLSSDGSGLEFFGGELALAGRGDTTIVGVSRYDGDFVYSGAAYVFVRKGSRWLEEARL